MNHCGASYEVLSSVIGCWRSDDERGMVLMQACVVVYGPGYCFLRAKRKVAEEGWLSSMSRKIECDGLLSAVFILQDQQDVWAQTPKP